MSSPSNQAPKNDIIDPPAKSTPKPELNNALPNPSRKSRSKMLILLTLSLLAIATILLLIWFFYFRLYESTDDAYANGNMINVNSAVQGSVIGFYADDTDLVQEGQLLVRLDATQYQLEYEKELAGLAAAVLQVRQLYDNVKYFSANRDSKQIKLKKAQYDYDNRAKLIGTLAISNEEYIHSKDDLSVAELDYKQAEFQLKMSLDAVGNHEMEFHPAIEEHKAKVREIYCKLQHCSIYAPATGYIAQRIIDVGEWVLPTTPIMAIIPIDYVWVDANFKETQLRYMRVGQPAMVTLDIYGSDVIYEGKVVGIASGTGSIFSLIPPQNATGNWIKIVQRLPVRISLDPERLKDFPVRLGLSAYVSVDIADVNLPKLVQTVSETPLGTTKVFDIDLTEVDALIDKIVAGS